MTSKLNRAKERLRSWQREYHNLRRMVKSARAIVDSSCGHCDLDEAEGAVVNHCDACCRRITTRLWSLLMQ